MENPTPSVDKVSCLTTSNYEQNAELSAKLRIMRLRSLGVNCDATTPQLQSRIPQNITRIKVPSALLNKNKPQKLSLSKVETDCPQ
jgi:hypothetical protein